MTVDPFADVPVATKQADPFANVQMAGGNSPASSVSSDPFADVVPRGTSKPFGWDMSTQKPATSVPGALATGLEGTVGGLINVPGSVAHGLKEAAVNPQNEAGQPSSWLQRAKEGLESSGQGLLQMGKGYVSPQASPLDIPAGALKAVGGLTGAIGLNQAQAEAAAASQSMAPPIPQSNSNAANIAGAAPGSWLIPVATGAVTDPSLVYGAGKAALGVGNAALDAGRSLAESFRPPVVDTEALAKNFAAVPASGEAARIRAMTTGESGPNPELPGSGFFEPPASKEVTGGKPLTEWDQAAIARGDLVKGPEGGPAWVQSPEAAAKGVKPGFFTDERAVQGNMNADPFDKVDSGLPTGPAKVKPEIAPDPRPADVKMAEASSATPEQKAQTASTNLDQDIQAAAAVGKNGAPKLSALAPEAMRADQQSVLNDFADLDQVAEQSRQVQGKGMLDTGYAKNVGLDYLNTQTSMVAGRAAEQINRGSEAVIAMQPEYNKMLQGAIDNLKKPTGFMGRFIRDTGAEERVAQALNGVVQKGSKLQEVGAAEAYKFLTPEEQKSFDLVKQINDKLALLEGRDITGKQVKDYWYRTPSNDPMVNALERKGYLYDPFTGNVVKPGKPTFDFARDPESQKLQWNYDLYDVMNQRIGQGVRKAIMDPIVTDIARDIAVRKEAGTINSGVEKYVNGILDRVQGRPGQFETELNNTLKAWTDWAKQFIPDAKAPFLKPVTELLDRVGMPGSVRKAQEVVSRAFYRAYVGANLGTAIKDLAKTINANAALGIKNTAVGAADFGKMMLSPESRAIFAKLGIRGDTEEMFKGLTDLAQNKGLLRAVDKGLFGPHQMVELFDRGVSYYAAMQDGAAKFEKAGIKPAPWMLDRYARGMTDMINFKYGPQNINPYLNNPVGKLYYQFSTAPAGQLNFMRRLQQMDSSTSATIGIGNAQVSNRVLKLLLLQGLVGYGLKKGIDADVKDLLSPVGQAKELASRATGGFYQGESNLPPPIVSLAGALRGTPEGIQSAKDLGKGMLHYPALASRKTDQLADELSTGQVLNKKGNVAYEVNPGEAWRKYLSLHPDVQQQYIDRAREYANRGK